MSRRKFDPAIKSLLHFDYPYFNEPGDGLGDEIGLETWSRQNANAYNANVYLCGTVIPYDQKFAPKFGYRCLLSYGGYIQCDNKSGIWNLNSNGQYEIEMFVQIARETGTRNIFSLMDTEKTTAIFKLSILSGGLLNIVSSGLSIESVSGVTPMQGQIWYHVLVRIFDGCLHLYLDGQIQLTAELLPETKLSVGQVRLGNDVGSIMGNDNVYIDEFLFRHSAGKDVPKVPTEPYNAQLNEANIGGYGTGADGDKMITEYTRLNSFGIIYEINNGTNLTVSLGEEGDCIFSSGSEVMIYVNSTGLYEFRKIISISHTEDGIYITLDKSIDIENGDTFTLNTTLIDTYLVHVISVPNYNTLTINAEATVRPSPYSGIVVFRCKNDCTIDGKILTSGYGIIRNDSIQMTHSQMIDRFMITHGGGIYIVCGGTLRIDENARLGASWSGLGENYNGATGLGGSSIVGNKVSLGGVGGGAGGRGGIWDEKAATTTANAIPGGAAGAKGSDGTGLNCCGGGGGCGGKGGNAISGGSSQDN